jgi:hypothetical protein
MYWKSTLRTIPGVDNDPEVGITGWCLHEESEILMWGGLALSGSGSYGQHGDWHFSFLLAWEHSVSP